MLNTQGFHKNKSHSALGNVMLIFGPPVSGGQNSYCCKKLLVPLTSVLAAITLFYNCKKSVKLIFLTLFAVF